MPDERDDEDEGLDRPPAFFPYDGEEESAIRDVDLGDPVEVTVEGVFYTESNSVVQRFVLLSDGDRKLPIMIGMAEATAISLPLEGAKPDRPLTHDLLKNMMERFGATLERVVIDDLWSRTYYAKLHLKAGKSEFQIDARPSDAIALALRVEAPIYVLQGILEQGVE